MAHQGLLQVKGRVGAVGSQHVADASVKAVRCPAMVSRPGFSGGQNSQRIARYGTEKIIEVLFTRIPRTRGAAAYGTPRRLSERSCGAGCDCRQTWLFGLPVFALVQQVQRDGGERPGLTSAERARIKELERENRELRQANEILKKGEPVKVPLVQAHRRTRILLRCERQCGTASALPVAARPPIPQVIAFIEESRGSFGGPRVQKLIRGINFPEERRSALAMVARTSGATWLDAAGRPLNLLREGCDCPRSGPRLGQGEVGCGHVHPD